MSLPSVPCVAVPERVYHLELASWDINHHVYGGWYLKMVALNDVCYASCVHANEGDGSWYGHACARILAEWYPVSGYHSANILSNQLERSDLRSNQIDDPSIWLLLRSLRSICLISTHKFTAGKFDGNDVHISGTSSGSLLRHVPWRNNDPDDVPEMCLSTVLVVPQHFKSLSAVVISLGS